MKRLLLILALSTTVLAAKQRDWRNGKLVSFTDAESSRPTQVLSGGVIVNAARITYHAEIRDGSTSYFGESTMGRRAHIPRLIENAPVKYSVEKDSIYLLGEDGKELKMRLIKERSE